MKFLKRFKIMKYFVLFYVFYKDIYIIVMFNIDYNLYSY